MKLIKLTERSKTIRERYHQLEIKSQGHSWPLEQDALAFLTDAGLVDCFVMSQQERWPVGGTEKKDLEHKLGRINMVAHCIGSQNGI